MTQEPFHVSAIIPVYNGERFLAEAVESVLRQDHEPLEIVIVDDGSTDGTAAIAQEFHGKVRYVYQKNAGPPAARNRGLRIAQGDVIAFLDADDKWPENKLEIQLACLARDPLAEISVGRLQFILMEDGKERIPSREPFSGPLPSMNLGSMVIRKRVFEKVGLFDESQLHADDVDWCLRAREMGVRMVTHPEATLLYRRHENNITNLRSVDSQYVVRALKKSLDRRREGKRENADSLPKWTELESWRARPGNGSEVSP